LIEDAEIAKRDGDYVKAASLLHRAAKQGDVHAQLDLGLMLSGKTGAEIGNMKAARWFTRAAEQGNEQAQYNIGLMYKTGQGVEQNFVRAYMWLSLSAAQGNLNAAKERDAIAVNLSPEHLAEAQKLVREWRPKKQ